MVTEHENGLCGERKSKRQNREWNGSLPLTALISSRA
jgi:hypothetical protein